MKTKIFPVLCLFFVFSFCLCSLKAQEDEYQAPNYEQIKQDIAQKDGNFYYPTLVERLHQSDTTMTMEQLRALYYGTVFQSDYNPYGRCDELEKVLNLLQEGQPSKKDLKRALTSLKKLEAKYPTNLRIYFYKAIASLELYGEYSAEKAKAFNQLYMLCYAIMSTGDGSDYEKAFHIVATDQSYTLMAILGFSPTEQALHEHEGQMYDVFPLEENEAEIDELYFNVTPCIKYLDKVFSDEGIASDEPQSEVTIPLNSQFTLELVEDKKGSYKLKLIDIQKYTDTLCWDEEQKFDDLQPNIIQGYFCYADYCDKEDSDLDVVLIFKSNSATKYLQYDSALEYNRSGSFSPTSNVGAYSGTVITEMWKAKDGITAIRIGNFRE